MYTVIEGPDLGGKGSFIKGMLAYYLENNISVFDVNKFWDDSLLSSDSGFNPNITNFRDSKIILVSEPTNVGRGKEIREKKIRNGSKTTPSEIAQAYSDDRLVLLEHVIIPALKANKQVISDRNFLSSIVIQPIHAAINGSKLSIDTIMELQGNQLAYSIMPDNIVVVYATPDELIDRVKIRTGKQDDTLYEKREFLEQIVPAYTSEWFNKFCGNKIKFVDTSKTKPDDTFRKGYEFAKNLDSKI